jgi:hypothetical protein
MKKYSFDDIFLSISPLMLLYWFNTVDNIKRFLILQVCVGSLLYWNYKNIYTLLIDLFSASSFILYYLFLTYRKNKFIQMFVFSLFILIFFLCSFLQGQQGKRQIVYHLIFRFAVLVLFLQTEYTMLGI